MASGVTDEVKELNSRFRAMLTATHVKHWRTERNSTYDFWNYGYPKATRFFLENVKQYILGQP